MQNAIPRRVTDHIEPLCLDESELTVRVEPAVKTHRKPGMPILRQRTLPSLLLSRRQSQATTNRRKARPRNAEACAPSTKGVSRRFSCKIIGSSRSTSRRECHDRRSGLCAQIISLAEANPQCRFRRIHALLGLGVNL